MSHIAGLLTAAVAWCSAPCIKRMLMLPPVHNNGVGIYCMLTAERVATAHVMLMQLLFVCSH